MSAILSASQFNKLIDRLVDLCTEAYAKVDWDADLSTREIRAIMDADGTLTSIEELSETISRESDGNEELEDIYMDRMDDAFVVGEVLSETYLDEDEV